MPRSKLPDVEPEELLKQAFRITYRELGRYERAKVLTPPEAQALQGYTRVLLSAARKQQEADDEELEGLTDEEIERREREILQRAGK